MLGMKRTYVLLLVLIGLAVLSCKNGGNRNQKEASERAEYKTIEKVDIRMDIPAGMTAQDDLNEFAILQFANPKTGRYMIVLSDEKTMLADMMSEDGETETSAPDMDTYTSMIAGMMNPQDWEITDTLTVNGHKALMAAFSGETEGQSVQYRLGIVEGPDAFYQIMLWTPEEKSNGFDEFGMRVLKSFAIISPQ